MFGMKIVSVFVSLVLTIFRPGATFGYINLADDWEVSPISTSNAAFCAMKRASILDIPGFSLVIVKDGMIAVQSYDQEQPPRELVEVFSTTKSWSSMIIGHLMARGFVSLNTTLGEIFNNESSWVDVPQAVEKQQIRLEEVLTYSGGLIDSDQYYLQSTVQDVLGGFRFEADRRGFFSYMAFSHIVSRIIYQVSGGLTPREYVVENGIFQAMGIAEDDYDWLEFGGVQGSAFGFQATAQLQAKLGVLYLQNGYASDDLALIDSDYVQASGVNQLPEGVSASRDENQPQGYGYNWWTDTPSLPAYLDGSYTAIGALGQNIVVVPKLNMVVTVVTDAEYDLLRLFPIFLNLDKVDIEEECPDPEAESTNPVVEQPTEAPDDSTEPTSGESLSMSIGVWPVLFLMAAVLVSSR